MKRGGWGCGETCLYGVEWWASRLHHLGGHLGEAEEGAGDVEGDGEVGRIAGEVHLQQPLLVLYGTVGTALRK